MSPAETEFLVRLAIVFAIGMGAGLAAIAYAIRTNRRDRALPPAE